MKKKCSFDPCTNMTRARLCSSHYWQQANGLELRPIKAIAKSGEGTIKDGYRNISKKGHPNAWGNGVIAEHRWVMSEMLGRPLHPGENVHHKNGDKLDNRPENLELWVTLQPRGQRIEDLLEYAYTIIDRYGEENGTRERDIRREPSDSIGAGGVCPTTETPEPATVDPKLH